ncbi:MAG: 3-deoxy-manno-octulosonate cytidylyltransferase [Spirochaetes bacterium]|nr:3-deoxy-manno-octulosonate cytidylyltransferase [Spirochaetota bacterium]
MKIIGIIPARYGSSRFPGKPLVKIAGKTLIERVYRRSEQAGLAKIIVATDDNRIEREVLSFGGNAAMTGEHHSGTDRIAEAAENESCDAVINIQGDEPLIDPEIIGTVSSALEKNAWADMATAAAEIKEHDDIDNPNVVKVVFAADGRAFYFSRSGIPYIVRADGKTPQAKRYRHIGIYGYRKEFLKKFTVLKPSPLESAESLEQLRALENGFSIHVSVVDYKGAAVDTPEDVIIVENILSGENKK